MDRRLAALMPAVLVVTLLATATPASAYQRLGTRTIESVSSNGTAGNGRSGWGSGQTGFETSMSPNGRFIAFASSASNLVPGDVNGETDAFLHDRKLGTTTLVSVGIDGAPAVAPLCGGSSSPSVSANGRYVAFVSCAANIVPGTTITQENVFVRDMRIGKTVLADVSSSNATANGPTGPGAATISANGRFVAFVSAASNLVPGDTNGSCGNAALDVLSGFGIVICGGWDVFVHDLKSGSTVRASVTSKGAQSMGGDTYDSQQTPSLSATGRYVVFASGAPDLMPPMPRPCKQVSLDEPTRGCNGVFVHDMKTGRTTIVSVASDGTAGDGLSFLETNESISANGRYVAFGSSSDNLVPNDTNAVTGGFDVFVHDMRTGRTERDSVTSSGGQLVDPYVPAISGNGRFVAFTESDSTSEAHDTVYVHDRLTGTSVAVASGRSKGFGGVPLSGPLDASGRDELYSEGDTSSVVITGPTQQVYLYDQGPTLGVGGFGSPRHQGGGGGGGGAICVEDVCLPPLEAVSGGDPADDVNAALAAEGGDMIGASLAVRPRTRDLFARLEVAGLPPAADGRSVFLDGLDLTANGAPYEIRAEHAGPDRFGLFRRDAPGPWRRVAALHGGYGTTGDEVVFAIPLRDLGLQAGGRLTHVEAFTSLGAFDTGPIRFVDRASIG